MRVRTPGSDGYTTGAVAQVAKNKKPLKPLIFLMVIVIIALAAFWILHKHNAKKHTPQTTSLKDLSSIVDKSTQAQVTKGDYSTFQTAQDLIAKKYIIEKDLPHAEQVMNNVLSTVPKNKIMSQTYFTMVDLEAAKHDTTSQKKYLQLLIATLKAEGDSQGAAAEQKYLDSLK
jgi:hypothetical protein